MGLEGLSAISFGYILAGEVNRGKMHWGLKQSNDERSKVPTLKLVVLAGEECKATYRGTHCTSFEPCNAKYIQELEETLGPEVPQTMVQQIYGQPRPGTGTTRGKRKRSQAESRKVFSKRRSIFQELVNDIQSV